MIFTTIKSVRNIMGKLVIEIESEFHTVSAEYVRTSLR